MRETIRIWNQTPEASRNCEAFYWLERRQNMDYFIVIWLGLLILILGMGIAQWIKNENSPVLTVPAKILDMRRRTHHHHHGNGHHHHSHSYHVTFEVATGERLVLRVRRSEYDQLFIGDRGTLTHQGTRYLGFDRT